VVLEGNVSHIHCICCARLNIDAIVSNLLVVVTPPFVTHENFKAFEPTKNEIKTL
jgi:hypothetical protein